MCLSALCPRRSCFPIRAHVTEALQCSPPREGAGQGVQAPLPSSLMATSTAHRAPRHTHTHAHTHSGQTGRQTLGPEFLHFPGLPPTPHPCPLLAPQDGPTGGPLTSPLLPWGWGSWLCPALLAPGLGVSSPPEPAGAPVTVGLATEIYWIKNKVIFILHMPQSLAASPPSFGVRAGTGAQAAFGTCLAVLRALETLEGDRPALRKPLVYGSQPVRDPCREAGGGGGETASAFRESPARERKPPQLSESP